MGNAVRMQVHHRPKQRPVVENLVPGEIDLIDLDLGAFVNLEDHGHAGGRDLMELRLNRRELPPALRQKLLQDNRGVLNLVGIVLRIRAQTDFPFLEAIQNLGLLNRLQTVKVEGSDHRALHHIKNYDPAGLSGLDSPGYVIEPVSVPQRYVVAIDGCRIVGVALFRQDERSKRVLRDALCPAEDHVLDNVLRRSSRRGSWLPGRAGSRWLRSLGRRRLGNVLKRIRDLRLRRFRLGGLR